MPGKGQFLRSYSPGDIVGKDGAIYIGEKGFYIEPRGTKVRLIECECCNENCHNTFIAQENRIAKGFRSGKCDDCRRRKKTLHVPGEPINNDIDAPIFIKYIKKGKGIRSIAEYQCRKCGNNFIRSANDTETNKRYYCLDCLNSMRVVSHGEQLISLILEKNNIEFVREKSFDTCRSEYGNLLRFDFYLEKERILIEYDGEQHFSPIESFGGEQRLKRQQENDNIKNCWCLQNGYKLIRIPYTIYENGELTEDFLLDIIYNNF